jgi:hypothetical protein
MVRGDRREKSIATVSPGGKLAEKGDAMRLPASTARKS